jgi:quercetin dioxygenase-like cupin family protein
MTVFRVSGLSSSFPAFTRPPAWSCLALVAAACCIPAQADEPVPMQRLTPSEITALAPPANSGAPSAVQMTILTGDPTKPGLDTVRVNIAPHTQVRSHTHRDNRAVTVISGTWHMGYGTTFDAKSLKDLPPGSFYTEPAGQPHFAQTGNEPVVIWVTGHGPSDTKFVTP